MQKMHHQTISLSCEMSCEIILFLPLHGTGCTGNTSPDFLSCDDASNTLILLGRFKSKSETKLKNVFLKNTVIVLFLTLAKLDATLVFWWWISAKEPIKRPCIRTLAKRSIMAKVAS